jgi:hypothetical protein
MLMHQCYDDITKNWQSLQPYRAIFHKVMKSFQLLMDMSTSTLYVDGEKNLFGDTTSSCEFVGQSDAYSILGLPCCAKAR